MNKLWMLPAAAIALAAAATACGGDDDGGGGSDEDYVAAICAAQLKFQQAGDDLEDELAAVESEEDAIELILGPLGELISDFENANPPEDAEEYHNLVVDSFREMERTLEEERSIAALDELEELPDPPADVSARLDAIAAENQDCIDAGFTFSE